MQRVPSPSHQGHGSAERVCPFLLAQIFISCLTETCNSSCFACQLQVIVSASAQHLSRSAPGHLQNLCGPGHALGNQPKGYGRSAGCCALVAN